MGGCGWRLGNEGGLGDFRETRGVYEFCVELSMETSKHTRWRRRVGSGSARTLPLAVIAGFQHHRPESISQDTDLAYALQPPKTALRPLHGLRWAARWVAGRRCDPCPAAAVGRGRGNGKKTCAAPTKFRRCFYPRMMRPPRPSSMKECLWNSRTMSGSSGVNSASRSRLLTA